jgi:DNA adenine methylase
LPVSHLQHSTRNIWSEEIAVNYLFAFIDGKSRLSGTIIEMMLASREWFEEWKPQQAAGGLTTIQRAARYYYLQPLCFAGRVRGRTYGASPMSRPRINLLRIEEELSEVHLRLAEVTIEHLPWQQFIKAYDKPGTFFFLDPPYYKEPYYSHNSKISDFQELAEILSSV